MNLRQPVDARLQVELCLLRMLRPPGEAPALDALEMRVAALERGAVPPGAQSAMPPPQTPLDSAPVVDEPQENGAFTLERWRSEWPAIVEAVTRVDTMLAGVLRDCRPVEAEHSRLVVGTHGRFHMDTISKPDKTAAIAEAASHLAGAPVVVETRFTGGEAPPPEQPAGVNEVTQAVLNTFGGSRVVATRLRDDAGRQSPRTPRA
jgi:hypothetical protein